MPQGERTELHSNVISAQSIDASCLCYIDDIDDHGRLLGCDSSIFIINADGYYPILHRLIEDPGVQNNNTSPPKTVTLKVSHIRDIAIAVACAAVAYSYLTKPGPSDHDPSKTDPVAIVKEASPAIHQPVAVQEEESIHVDGGKLTLGDDEISNKFRGYLKQRISDVDAAGPVVLTGIRSASQAAVSPAPLSNTYEQPQRAQETRSPVVKSEVKQANASEVTDKGTLHPAPFVDKEAQASIDAITKQVIANKGAGVVQIGRHLDGTRMTEAETEQQIRGTLSNIPDEWTITYKAPNERVRLYVFTDTTCPFCHKLHAAMGELLNAGISVHYLLYPRDMGATPPGNLSRTAINMKNIWCSVDQKAAMNDAFEGYKVAEADCASLPASLNRRPAPVPDHYLAGSMFNVEATPTWLASNGKHDVGFSNAQTMIRTLLGN